MKITTPVKNTATSTPMIMANGEGPNDPTPGLSSPVVLEESLPLSLCCGHVDVPSRPVLLELVEAVVSLDGESM